VFRETRGSTVGLEQVLDFPEFTTWNGGVPHDDLLRVDNVGALETHERVEHGVASFLTRITDGIHIGERLRNKTIEEL
jgi:hypothetical protein